REACCIGGGPEKVMPITCDGAVNVGPGSRSAGSVAGAVRSRIPSNDGVFQSYGAWADADPSACTFGHETWGADSSTLVNSAVAGLSIVEAYRCVLDIHRGRIVVGNRAAVCKAASAVLGASAAPAVGFSAVAAVTAIGRVVCKRRGIDDEASAVCQDGASASGPTVKRDMSAKAVGTKGIAAAAASGAI